MIDAYIKCIDFNPKKVEIFNVGSGKSYSVKEIVGIITSNFSDDITVKFLGERRKQEVMNTVANIIKIGSILDWKPRTFMIDGIKKILETV